MVHGAWFIASESCNRLVRPFEEVGLPLRHRNPEALLEPFDLVAGSHLRLPVARFRSCPNFPSKAIVISVDLEIPEAAFAVDRRFDECPIAIGSEGRGDVCLWIVRVEREDLGIQVEFDRPHVVRRVLEVDLCKVQIKVGADVPL